MERELLLHDFAREAVLGRAKGGLHTLAQEGLHLTFMFEPGLGGAEEDENDYSSHEDQ
eukprot:CAMPEP_0113716918 /NCGR_PEP_ID=MMETSP0038_2-20120614/34196_1 /TAXON_ID=2898 /ORGANISM="Cryptomonas paramecium" /LENGTH=57 /DNA_ID=CAMNT_0000644573 /DNA_START=53 /DNA_END=226 /DNA_ORIENTATION=+ /assembly_acc=CAM_ASM_000170